MTVSSIASTISDQQIRCATIDTGGIVWSSLK